MNQNKFTLKTQDAIGAAQQLAEKYNHPALEPEHLLLALLTQQEGIVPPLVDKLGADRNLLVSETEQMLSKMV